MKKQQQNKSAKEKQKRENEFFAHNVRNEHQMGMEHKAMSEEKRDINITSPWTIWCIGWGARVACACAHPTICVTVYTHGRFTAFYNSRWAQIKSME